MLIERKERLSYASHHQFYIEDAINPGDTGDPSFWTDSAYTDKLAIVERTIGIGAGSYGFVKIVSELHDSEPDLDLDAWDHVTEASLMVMSDTIQVIGCLDNDGERFTVPPGPYRVRCCHADLAVAVQDGQGDDWYVVQIWPAAESPRAILKRWGG